MSARTPTDPQAHPDLPGSPERLSESRTGPRGDTSGATDPKPWDTPGLPPREPNERCATHRQGRAGNAGVNVLCQYRDDDPARCPICHRRYGIPNGCGKTDRCIGSGAA